MAGLDPDELLVPPALREHDPTVRCAVAAPSSAQRVMCGTCGAGPPAPTGQPSGLRSRPARVHRALLLVLALLAVPVALVLTAGPAHACSCAPRTFPEQVASADAVLTGTATSREDPAGSGDAVSSASSIRWGFAVDTVHRGDLAARVTVVAAMSGASCGIAFTPGVRYVVVGMRDPVGDVETGLCTGTAPVAALSPADLAALGPGRPVPPPAALPPAAPAPAAPVEGAGGRAVGPLGFLLLGGTVALTAGLALVAVRRRRASRRA